MDTLRKGDLGHDVRVLQTKLNTLGADLVVDGIFGDKTLDAVCDLQRHAKLVEDGIVGPKTWRAIEDALALKKHEDSLPPPPKTDDDLRAAGERAIERAAKLWQLDIYDPKRGDDTMDARRCKHAIDLMIRNGLGWAWEPPYAGDGDFEWCGAFAAVCWFAVKPELRRVYFASTYRLDRFGAYRPAFDEDVSVDRNAEGARLRAVVDGNEKVALPFEPRPGDILLVGQRSYGHHIALVEHYDVEARIFDTIEGNAFGDGPHGERQQGVVRYRRELRNVRRIIRPGVGDLL